MDDQKDYGDVFYKDSRNRHDAHNGKKVSEIVDLGNQEVPYGIKISVNNFGYCLIATKNFTEGEVIYQNTVKTVPGNTKKYQFQIDGKNYVSDCVNSVKYQDQRHAYTFDGFMNHSCSQNTISRMKENNYTSYEQIAIKNIQEGDQITCNYLHFDYECNGHEFICSCGTEKCYGNIRGFKNLKLHEQLQILSKVDKEIKDMWLKDNQNIWLVEDLRIPEQIELVQYENYGKKLIAKKQFKKGDIIFKNKPDLIPQNSILIVKVFGKYEELDLISHTINKGELRQFLYFDSFMNHSCNPNSIMVQQGQNEIEICLRQIKVGEQITCDYAVFDKMNDCQQIQCLCNSENCRKVIQGKRSQGNSQLN